MLQESKLFQEIHQQPQVLATLLQEERSNLHSLAVAIRDGQISQVVIAARGTSDNAGRYAQYLLGAQNGLNVSLAAPSLFTLYGQPPSLRGSLVLGISQSGKSPDIVAVLAEARRQGCLTAAMTNTVDSDLAQQADWVIDLHAGAEESVAATKSYTAQLMAIAMLSAHLTESPDPWAALQTTPDAVHQTLALEARIGVAAERYRYMQHCAVIGRGMNYATAFELALKLKELTYTIAEPYSSADFMHGPLALIDPGFPVLCVAPGGKVFPELLAFMQALVARQAELLVISEQEQALSLARVPFSLPATTPEWLSPITAIVPGQLLAMHLAATRGIDLDHPRAIRKVTETN